MIADNVGKNFSLGYLDLKTNEHKTGVYTNHSKDTEYIRSRPIIQPSEYKNYPLLSEFIEDLQKLLKKHGDGYIFIDGDKHYSDETLESIDVYVTSHKPIYENRKIYYL